MNLSKLKQINPKNKLIFPFLLFLFFLTFVFLNKSSLFPKFDPNMVSNYLRSQDIEDIDNKIKDRVFISDSDIYIASGYLYANGADPIDFNLHPPFIKYLFGLSAKYFNFPLLPNIVFSLSMLFGVYVLGAKGFKSPLIGLLGSIILIFDPVFKEVTTYALLDLGQATFILWFLIITLYYPKLYLLEGILLGLAMASKFWTPVLFFLAIIYGFKYLVKKEKIDIKKILLVIITTFLTFSLTYLVSFIESGGFFNIFFWQARILRFMLDHNVTVEWGSVLKMFFGGYFFWTILFISNIYLLLKTNIKDIKFLFYLIPVAYLSMLTFQLPFTRYFILFLPLLYLSFLELIITKIKIKTPLTKIS